jgi:NIPSNAP protein
MIVEERIYTLHAGKVPDMMKLYGEEGLPLQQRYLGKFIGYFSTETGNLNQVVFLWGYDSLDDRDARRARMARDPEWQAYLKKVQPLIMTQENRILKPAPFSPIR